MDQPAFRSRPIERRSSIAHWVVLIFVSCWVPAPLLLDAATDPPFLGRQFMGWDRFTEFQRVTRDSQTVLTSPEVHAHIDFTELIVSWNAKLPEQGYLIVEARAFHGEAATKYYTMGVWSRHSVTHPQTSVPDQTDQDGTVATDTLQLHLRATRFQLRVTLGGNGEAASLLKYIGVSVCDPSARLSSLAPNRAAWGKTIPVLERSQMAYPNGKVLCSPTTVSMLLSYWAARLEQPELDKQVPEVAEGVYDVAWKGTGNWCFNVAYAGSSQGLRAYVTRLADVSEIETWISAGIPIGLSVDYDRLRAKGSGPNGHLVVCVGFTSTGDVIINDPGTSEHVRKVFPRNQLVDAWSCSHNTAYLIYPENLATPVDTYGHWDSQRTLQPTSAVNVDGTLPQH